jgi:hypothetical protein
MNSCATYDDVNLILRLYDLRREEKLRQAREWFVKSFHVSSLDELNALCPVGSENNAYYRMVISYWDMVASFVASGVPQAELFFESNRELLLVWERVRAVIPAVRESNKDPKSFHNIETVAELYIEWLKKRGPGVYEAFAARMSAKPAR